MSYLFTKKSKKSPKPFQQCISLGIPTNIVAGPLGFRAELDISPKGGESNGGSRIVFHDEKSEGKRPPIPEISTSDAIVGGTEHGNNPSKDIVDAGEEEGESSEPSGATKRDWKGTALGGAAILFNIAKEAADGFGPLKAALGAISAIYENYEETVAVREKVDNILSRIAVLEGYFSAPSEDVAEKKRRDQLLRKLEGSKKQLQLMCERSSLRQFAEHIQDNEDVVQLLEDLQQAINDYQMVQQMAMDARGYKLMDAAEYSALNSFRCAEGAEYEHESDRRGCLEGTRTAILDEIELWARDFDQSPIYWLNGLAGTGKSAIAQTIAERLSANGQLGASFFCSRDYSDRSNLRLIFPTLAIQLARNYAEIRSILIPLIQSKPGIVHESLYKQMNQLIVQPLKDTATSTIFVIDAIDECKDEEPASAILSVLGRLVSEIPKVKFFLTGRPETRIMEGFRLPLMVEATDVFVLHEVEPSQVDNDIRQFFKHGFSELADRRRGLGDWPTEEHLDRLCDRAAGLFVYAVATMKFIGHKNDSPKKRLNFLIQSPESSACEGKIKLKEGTTLDSLYTSILQEAFDDDDPQDDPRIRSVLGAVVLAANPLSPSAIATLSGLDTEEVFPLLSSMQSLLIFREDVEYPVRPFHKTFPDFIVDPTRCTNQRFCISPLDHHPKLLIRCLKLMSQGLVKNMCNLPDAVTNSEVKDLQKRTERYVNEALRYACKSWHKHLLEARTIPTHTQTITTILDRFLKAKFLAWLETLSVLSTARTAIDALEVAARWLEKPQILDLVNECFCFATGFFEVINASAPHIYHTALALIPETSILRKLYERDTDPFARVVRGLPSSWDPSMATSKRTRAIQAVVWSPCSRFIAIVWDGTTTIEILDQVTLERLYTLNCPEGAVRSLIFSPDSRSLTCCGARPDQFIVSWDLQTGGVVSTIWVEQVGFPTQHISIAYSADRKMVGVQHRHPENTNLLCVFDAHSGALVHSHRLKMLLTDAIWTHGESLRFVIVQRWSVTIWELGFASGATPTEVESFSTPGTPDPANCVWFSPLYRLAFIVKDMVSVWNAREKRFLLYDPNNVKGPSNISFSPDGRFFACGTTGRDLYLWMETPTGYTPHRSFTSSSLHPMPLISPDNRSVIVNARGEIQLWWLGGSATSSSLSGFSAPREDDTDFIVEFSPDEAFVAVARQEGKAVTVFDLKLGVRRLVIDAAMEVCGLKAAGNTIVVCGVRGIVTWNIPTGAVDIKANTKDSIQTTTFNLHMSAGEPYRASLSPDLLRIALVEKPWPGDHLYLRVYDVSTGGAPLVRIQTSGECPWFAPEGREIWCNGINGQIEGWIVFKENSDSTNLELWQIAPTEEPPKECPWRSSRGYEVTENGWILNSSGKRLFWLPHSWRSGGSTRTWDGRFLALQHRELQEAVIVELDE